jgi:type VI secretion system protein VasD
MSLGFTLFLSACGGPGAPPPTVVELTFVAAPDINPNPAGRPQPVFVRYYQLAATSAFDSADYFQLHDKESALLGASLLDRQELPLTPGTSQTISITAKPGTTAIGIAAGYRDIDRAQWRAEAPVAAGKTTKLKVQLSKLSVSVAPDKQ